jgi:hypothetical protein
MALGSTGWCFLGAFSSYGGSMDYHKCVGRGYACTALIGLASIAFPAASGAQTIANQIPQPPPALPVPHGPALFYALFNLLLSVLVVVLLVREAVRARSALPFAFLVGACLAGLVEPIFDGNIHVTFAQPIATASWLFYNVPYPWYVIPGNAVLAGPVYWMYLKFQRGISATGLWVFFLVWWAADAFQEIPGTTLGFFAYYGPHPFKLSGWPAWIGMLAGLGLPLAGYACYALRNAFSGIRLYLLIAILMPVVIYGSEEIAWPMWITLNGGKDLVVTRLMALLSLAFTLGAYHSMIMVYSKSRPLPAPAIQGVRAQAAA